MTEKNIQTYNRVRKRDRLTKRQGQAKERQKDSNTGRHHLHELISTSGQYCAHYLYLDIIITSKQNESNL